MSTRTPFPLPADLAALVAAATWSQNTLGMTDAAVYCLTYPDGTQHYLKTARHSAAAPLPPEIARLRWLQGRLPVPQVRYAGADADRAFLLMTAVPGRVACDEALAPALTQAGIVALLADGLRQLHALPAAGCPFDRRLNVTLAEAAARVEAGLVAADDFDEERQGRTPAEVLDELYDTVPDDEEVVFTHGDYCLPNILLDAAARRVTGFIDVGRAGLADRYQDLALAQRSIIYNFGAAYLPHFWKAYGLRKVDHAKVAFYRLLDEFF
ncbi:MAG: aminoglycoside 3'-phosphotransferase [Anaerolineae bacterium]|nr:aminoglycoside 3'-phosphotransferase [Anaerolineae bacterium]